MLVGAAIFMVLLITLLTVPVTLRYQISWHQEFQGGVELHWLSGLVQLRLHTRESVPHLPDEGKEGQQTGRPGRSPGSRRNVLALVRLKPFRRRIIRFVGDCWHAVRMRNLMLRLHIGLGDPADTGRLWGLAGPVAGMLAGTRGASIEIVPEFLDATFELDSSGDFRIVPLQMIYLAAGLLLSPAMWQGLKHLRTAG